MTRICRPRMLVLALLLSLGSPSFAHGQESIRHSFQSLAGQVVAEFQRATDGIRKPHFDIRRRDTFPDVNAEMVGMLKFEMKPKDEAGRHPVVCVFGYPEGRWRFWKAFPELASPRPTWPAARAWCQEISAR